MEEGCSSEGLLPRPQMWTIPRDPPGSQGPLESAEAPVASVMHHVVVNMSLCPAYLPCYSHVSPGTTWQETFFTDFPS